MLLKFKYNLITMTANNKDSNKINNYHFGAFIEIELPKNIDFKKAIKYKDYYIIEISNEQFNIKERLYIQNNDIIEKDLSTCDNSQTKSSISTTVSNKFLINDKSKDYKNKDICFFIKIFCKKKNKFKLLIKDSFKSTQLNNVYNYQINNVINTNIIYSVFNLKYEIFDISSLNIPNENNIMNNISIINNEVKCYLSSNLDNVVKTNNNKDLKNLHDNNNYNNNNNNNNSNKNQNDKHKHMPSLLNKNTFTNNNDTFKETSNNDEDSFIDNLSYTTVSVDSSFDYIGDINVSEELKENNKKIELFSSILTDEINMDPKLQER